MMSDAAHTARRLNARRPKTQVCCTLCKTKKLKCDRKLPCKNCQKRPPGSCIYVAKASHGQAPRDESQEQLSSVYERVKRLEHLLISSAKSHNGENFDLDSQQGGEGDHSSLSSTPALASHGLETRLIDTTSWEAILEDIDTIKCEINAIQGCQPSPSSKPPLLPSLLFDTTEVVSIEDAVNFLPSRPITDRLVNLFTRGLDIPALPIHLPTFLKDYEAFWDDPASVCLPWLSMLFSVISLALQFILKSGKTIEGIPFIEAASKRYALTAAACLRKSDYAMPTPKTVEALILNFLSEHIWLGEYHFRASLALGLAIRVAVRAGYHRDPSHYPQISVFDGEMRRRLWSYLFQLDCKFASFLGLPRQIDDSRADSSPPSALPDEEIHTGMTELPSTPSSNQPSTIGFLNHRAQLLTILGRIEDYTTSFQDISHEKILYLDQILDVQVSTRPAWLVEPAFCDKHADDSVAINQALEIDLLQQRARITLHRKFLALARTNSKYIHSRNSCLTAAARILRHQKTMCNVIFKVDDMVVENWRAISIMSHNFLVAAMIICLDVDQEIRYGPIPDAQGVSGLEENLGLLQSCREFWAGRTNVNPGAEKATRIVGAVIAQAVVMRSFDIKDNKGEEGRPSSLEATSAESMQTQNPSDALDLMFAGDGFMHNSQDLQNMVSDFPMGLDWDGWGSYEQGSSQL